MSEHGEIPPSMREELEALGRDIAERYEEGYVLDEDERRELRFLSNLDDPRHGALASAVAESAIDSLILAESFHNSGKLTRRTEGELRALFNHHVVQRGDFWRAQVLPKIILHPELGVDKIQSVAVERVLNSIDLTESRQR